MKGTEGQQVYVLFNRDSNRFLSFDPVTDRYNEVRELKELKIWDWLYNDNAEVSWKAYCDRTRGIEIRKLSFLESKALRAGKGFKLLKLGRIINFLVWPKNR